MNLVLNKKDNTMKAGRTIAFMMRNFAAAMGLRDVFTRGRRRKNCPAPIRLSIFFPANSIVFAEVQNYVCDALFARKHYERLELRIERCPFYIPGKIK